MSTIDSIRVTYKQDDCKNPLYARVSWSTSSFDSPRPLALAFHGGGLMVGSSEMIPKPQIAHFCSQGFVVVAPNYRLAPQVTGKQVFTDCEDAFDWAATHLANILLDDHAIEIDPQRIVAFGHSAGGTLALHTASCKPVKAVTAFYPSLYTADRSTSIHLPTNAPPFGLMPDFSPTDQDWKAIRPEGIQLSETPLATPGTPPAPRSKWQMHILKHGQWPATIQPDGDFAAIDPMTRLNEHWAPVMIVQGAADMVPGTSLELAERAEKDLKKSGVEVRLQVVPGERHMFDAPPEVGTTDLGPKWQAVMAGLQWLKEHV